jgi:hypothetical protein
MGHCGLVAVAGISPDDLVAACVIDVEEWIAASSSPYGKDFCPRARWPLKGCQSSLALTLFSPPAFHRFACLSKPCAVVRSS